MAKQRKVPFVKITWYDAADPLGGGSWYDESEVKQFALEDTIVVSFGFAVERNAHYVVLVGDVVPQTLNGHTRLIFGRPTKIPVKTILKEETLFKGSLRPMKD